MPRVGGEREPDDDGRLNLSSEIEAPKERDNKAQGYALGLRNQGLQP